MRSLACLILAIAACSPPARTPPTAAGSTAMPPPAGPLRSRPEFARLIATLRPGMTDAEVTAALGVPDDIKTEHDPGGITASRTVEVWRYGTRGHLGFATLGTVHIQADRKVQYVFGGKGTPAAGFDEAELRRVLELIDAVPSYNAPLDPLALIRAVNALQRLGKDAALSAIDEYLRVSSWLDDPGREGVFLVMRTLFAVPDGGMPPMMVGASGLQPPADPRALPRWPLAIVDDIPVKLVGGYMLAGEAEPPETDVAWFRAHGALRSAPLHPPARPLDAIDGFVDGPLARLITVDDAIRTQLYDQALRLIATVHRPAETYDGWFAYGPDVGKRWTAVRAELATLAPVWNPSEDQYTFAGGGTLAAPRTHWPRVWWDTGLAGATSARLILERVSDDVVEVELRIELASGASIAAGAVRLADTTTAATLATLTIAATAAPVNSTSGSVSSQRIKLPAGHAVHVELVQPSGSTTTELTP